ncbi:hypothetical protein Leryth_016824 [Lithospermum erythrorhizon]|nr:hypothetical protein Leryth_016824 [Lithospermum erythrorhizon]
MIKFEIWIKIKDGFVKWTIGHTYGLVDNGNGFISIDCGLQGPDYIEERNGIYYTSDVEFVESGLIKSVSSVYSSDINIPQQLRH